MYTFFFPPRSGVSSREGAREAVCRLGARVQKADVSRGNALQQEAHGGGNCKNDRQAAAQRVEAPKEDRSIRHRVRIPRIRKCLHAGAETLNGFRF